MSLATVYKNVQLIKSVGEVLELGFPNGSNRYDGNKPAPHPHVICTECKRIVDANLESLNEMEKEIEMETRFKILNHRLDFFGIWQLYGRERLAYFSIYLMKLRNVQTSTQ